MALSQEKKVCIFGRFDMKNFYMRKFPLLLLCLLFTHAALTMDHAPADSAQIDLDTDSLLVCDGTSITLSATPADSYDWSPAADIDDPQAQTVTITPSQSQWYFLDATVSGVVCRDSVYLELIDPTFEAIVSTTDTVCPEERVDVTFDASHPITSVVWEPEDEVIDPENTDGSRVRPLRTTEYIVTATIGNCEVSDTFTIHVIPFELSLITTDTIFVCKPDTVNISLSVSPPGLTIDWTPLDGFIDPTGNTASVYPEVSTRYTATTSHMGCTLSRTTLIKVDSLPDLEPLTAIPFKDPYCAGDTFWIIGPSVDTALYPDIEWVWMPRDGQIVGPDTPGTTGNVRVSILDTTTFIRRADNNACSDTSSITLNAIPPEIPLSLNDTAACPGETFQVFVLDPNVMDLEWMPSTGLSCTNCPDPMVTVQAEPITYMLTGNKEDCPVTAQLTVNPLPTFLIPVIPPQATGCEGDQVQLDINDAGLTNLNIAVTEGDATVSCTDCNNPVVTIIGSGQIVVTADIADSSGCGAFAIIPYGIGDVETMLIVESLCRDEPTPIDLSIYGFENPVVVDDGGIADCDNTDCVVTIGSLGGEIVVESDDYAEGFCGKETTIRFIPFPNDEGMIVALDSMPYGQGQSITVQLDPAGPPGTQYEWYVDGVLQDDTGNPAIITFGTQMAQAEVKVVWINSQGCMQMATMTYELVEPGIQFPNAFTPNNDGTNDMFRPQVTGPAVLDELLVFNRWGQVVYEGSDPDGWDGRFKGELAPPEVYAYVGMFRFPNGDKIEYKGDVTLIR